jgi:hypothetical protein
LATKEEGVIVKCLDVLLSKMLREPQLGFEVVVLEKPDRLQG